MNRVNEATDKSEDHDMTGLIERPYVPRGFYPGAPGNCPLIKVPEDVTYSEQVDADKHMIVEMGLENTISIPRDRIVSNPGFVVLELGHAKKDHSISTSADAIKSGLTSMFVGGGPEVNYERCRTTVEIREIMKEHRDLWSHIVIIGHGTSGGIKFLDRESPATGLELSALLGCDEGCRDVEIISLCCHSGCSLVAKTLSSAPNVTEVIAPEKGFEIQWAEMFILGYYMKLFNGTGTVNEAVTETAKWCDDQPMVIWRDGKKVKE